MTASVCCCCGGHIELRDPANPNVCFACAHLLDDDWAAVTTWAAPEEPPAFMIEPDPAPNQRPSAR